MKYFDLVQGSPEWFAARAGIPTTSKFGSIMTPAKMEYAKTAADTYQDLLIAELLLGKPLDADAFKSFSMDRGGEYEGDAASLYEMMTGETLSRGGFCTDDDFTMGASPDRRILREDGTVKGLVEIKCPDAQTHVRNLLSSVIDRKYIPQVQGQMLVTGAEYVDWFSYHPELAPSLVHTERDENAIAVLRDYMARFNRELNEKLQRLVDMKHIVEIPKYIRPAEEEFFKDILAAG